MAQRDTLPFMDEKKTIDTEHQIIAVWEEEAVYPTPSHSARSFQHTLIFALLCSNVFFATCAVFFYSHAECPVEPRRNPFSFSSRRDARSSVRYQQQPFTGALKYNTTTGEPYRDFNSSEAQFVGNPRTTPDIDHAWKDLLRGEFFPLSDDEIAPYVEEGLIDKTSGPIRAELDVFRSLRCLNTVRLAVDRDYYGPQDGLEWSTSSDRDIIDYCLDHLRQTVQCSADLTVVPMLAQNSHVEAFSHPRTCRKWDDVRSWVDRRQERMRFLGQQYSGTV